MDEQDVKKRIGVVKHWIEVGEECLKLNNFDTLTAISCAIESTPVRRLHNTWEVKSKATPSVFGEVTWSLTIKS